MLGAFPGPGAAPAQARGGAGQPSPLCPGRHSKQPYTVCQDTDSRGVGRVAALPACGHPVASCGPQAVISDTVEPAFMGKNRPRDALIFKLQPKGPVWLQSKGSPELQTERSRMETRTEPQSSPPLTPNLRAAVGPSLAPRALRSPLQRFKAKGDSPANGRAEQALPAVLALPVRAGDEGPRAHCDPIGVSGIEGPKADPFQTLFNSQ